VKTQQLIANAPVKARSSC